MTYILIAYALVLALAAVLAYLRESRAERQRQERALKDWSPHPRAGWGNDGVEE